VELIFLSEKNSGNVSPTPKIPTLTAGCWSFAQEKKEIFIKILILKKKQLENRFLGFVQVWCQFFLQSLCLDMAKVEVRNKKVRFEFELLEDYNAGIVLTGTEMKSIRNGKASIVESFCVFMDGELYIRNMYVAEYENGSFYNHNPRRDRKLLLKRIELKKLEKKLKDKGVTVVPSLIFINEKNLAKVHIHLARGKKLHDKRSDLKDKDSKREMDRALKR
jgi:SsrA-binding protein